MSCTSCSRSPTTPNGPSPRIATAGGRLRARVGLSLTPGEAPAGLIVPHAVRVARHTDRLDAVVAFYRDRLGLPEIGRFRGHDGYDGTFLALPGTGAHLEFTSG